MVNHPSRSRAVALLAAAFLFASGCAGGASPAKTTVTPGSSNMVSEREERRPSETLVRVLPNAPPVTADQAAALDQAARNGWAAEIRTKDGGTIKTRQEGRAVGAGATAEGDKLSDAVTGTAPTLALPDGGSAAGGGVERDSSGSAVVLPPLPWANPLFWFGLACIAAAAACFIPQVKLVVGSGPQKVLFIAGVGLLAVAFYPAILLWAVIGIGLVVGVPYLIAEAKKKKAQEIAELEAADAYRKHEALRAVVAAVDHPTVSNEAREQVKNAVLKESDQADRDVIDDVKRDDEIGKYAPNPR